MKGQDNDNYPFKRKIVNDALICAAQSNRVNI